MKYSAAIIFFLHLLTCPFSSLFSFLQHFFCDGYVFSCWASTPLATRAVRYCHSSICVETQIRERTDISGQWALYACNTKPVMEVSPQTAIDVLWDCVSQDKRETHNMLNCGAWLLNVGIMWLRAESYWNPHFNIYQHTLSYYIYYILCVIII